MTKTDARPLYQRAGKAVMTSMMVLCLLLITSLSAFAATVTVKDAANVLDDEKVKSAGASISYPVIVSTVTNFEGDANAFIKEIANTVPKDTIALAINLSNGNQHLAIASGTSGILSASEIDAIEKSFVDTFNSSGDNYTEASISALGEIQTAVTTTSAPPATNNQPAPAPAPSGNAWGSTVLCLVGLLVIGGLVFFAVRSLRRRAHHRGYPGGYGSHYGHGGPYRHDSDDLHHDYPPGHYPPGYRRRHSGGLNPWVAGGLGAAAGGLLGYGLGQQMAENNEAQAAENPDAGGDMGGGDFGGGDFGGGDFGGGDFGGGEF